MKQYYGKQRQVDSDGILGGAPGIVKHKVAAASMAHFFRVHNTDRCCTSADICIKQNLWFFNQGLIITENWPPYYVGIIMFGGNHIEGEKNSLSMYYLK